MDDRVKERSARRDRAKPANGARGADDGAPLPLHPGARSAARTALAVALVAAALWTAREFLPALIWAAMLAIALWPLYRKVAERVSGGPSGASAFLFTLAVAVIVFLPIGLVTYEIAQQSDLLGSWIAQSQKNGIPVPDWVARLPVAADALAQWWRENLTKPESAAAWLQKIHAESVAKTFGGQLLQRGFMLFVALIALFVMLRHADLVGRQLLTTADRILGEPGDGLVEKTVDAVRGTVNGAVVVAVSEGLLIGAGYLLAGVPNAALFIVLTVAFAMVPFGAWAAFTVAAVALVAGGGSELAAAAVFGWGAVVMLSGDQFVWPLLIGGAARLPFLFAFVGIFGGVASFGLIGLFLGPVIMAAVLTIWREWVMRGSRRAAAARVEGKRNPDGA
jgi:predicted PurR-regulated permease PerM